MKNRLKQAAKWTGNALLAILIYIYLMIDRLVLVPFPMVASHSLQQYQKGPDRYIGFTLVRVALAVIVVILYLIIKYVL